VKFFLSVCLAHTGQASSLVLTIYSKLESHGSFNVGGVMTWTWVTGEQIWCQKGQRLRSLWKCLLHTSWWNLD